MPDMEKFTFVLGGAASGKSAYAESLAVQSGRPRVYVATAQAFDAEMKEKIRRHQEMRGTGWDTIEAPGDVGTALAGIDAKNVVLLDCATLWLGNFMLDGGDPAAAPRAFCDQIARCAAPLIVVSNEVGQGIVPAEAESRAFREAQGRLNQAAAARADRVVAVMAGLPLALKGPLP